MPFAQQCNQLCNFLQNTHVTNRLFPLGNIIAFVCAKSSVSLHFSHIYWYCRQHLFHLFEWIVVGCWHPSSINNNNFSINNQMNAAPFQINIKSLLVSSHTYPPNKPEHTFQQSAAAQKFLPPLALALAHTHSNAIWLCPFPPFTIFCPATCN